MLTIRTIGRGLLIKHEKHFGMEPPSTQSFGDYTPAVSEWQAPSAIDWRALAALDMNRPSG
jgi:hypothetical protein